MHHTHDLKDLAVFIWQFSSTFMHHQSTRKLTLDTIPNDARVLFMKILIGIWAGGYFQYVHDNNVHTNSNIQGGLSIFSIEHPRTENETYKVILVVQGYKDVDKLLMINTSRLVRYRSTILQTTMASSIKKEEVGNQDLIKHIPQDTTFKEMCRLNQELLSS